MIKVCLDCFWPLTTAYNSDSKYCPLEVDIESSIPESESTRSTISIPKKVRFQSDEVQLIPTKEELIADSSCGNLWFTKDECTNSKNQALAEAKDFVKKYPETIQSWSSNHMLLKHTLPFLTDYQIKNEAAEKNKKNV